MYKVKGNERARKLDSAKKRNRFPGSYRESGLHLRQEVIVREGRKAQAKRAERAAR